MYKLLLAMLLVSCAGGYAADPEEDSEIELAVLDEFEDACDVDIDGETRGDILDTVVWYVPHDQFYAHHKPNVLGTTNGVSIFIPDSVTGLAYTMVLIHEITHVTAGRVLGSIDPCHTDKRLFSCEESVEYKVSRGFGWTGKYASAYRCGKSSCGD